jgi:hypothetical protein
VTPAGVHLGQEPGELTAEKQILGFKPPRLEHGGEEHSEGVQDCKHRLK